MKTASNIVIKLLAALLLVAAALKAHQLLTEPLAGKDISSSRAFLILEVEFELALAVWFLSGLFKKTDRGKALLCYGPRLVPAVNLEAVLIIWTSWVFAYCDRVKFNH